MPVIPLPSIPTASKYSDVTTGTAALQEAVAAGILEGEDEEETTYNMSRLGTVLGPAAVGRVVLAGTIVLRAESGMGSVWQGGLMLRTECGLTHFADGETRQIAASEGIVPGTKGTIVGEAQFPFVMPIPVPSLLDSKGQRHDIPMASFEGESMALRYGLAVVVRRPWYTWDVARFFPFRVHLSGRDVLQIWRQRERLAIRRFLATKIKPGDKTADSGSLQMALKPDDLRNMPNIVLVDDCGGLVAVDLKTCARGITGSFAGTVATRMQPDQKPIVCIRLRVW